MYSLLYDTAHSPVAKFVFLLFIAEKVAFTVDLSVKTAT